MRITETIPAHAVDLAGAALVVCFALFTVITIRLLVIGARRYDRIAEVPLDDTRVVEPRDTRGKTRRRRQ